jgi:hypothetical protein
MNNMRKKADERNTTMRVRTYYLNQSFVENNIEKYCSGPTRVYSNKAEFLRSACVNFLMEFRGAQETMIYDEPPEAEMKSYSIAVSPMIFKYLEYLVYKGQFMNISDGIRIILDWYYIRIKALVNGLKGLDAYEIPDKIPTLKAPMVRSYRKWIENKRKVAKKKKEKWGFEKVEIPKALPEPSNQIFIPGQGLVTLRPTKIKGEA